MDKIFQVALCETGQRLIPTPEYQDMEPLDEEADKCEDPVDPEYDTNHYPVDNADEQFNSAGGLLEGKELFGRTLCFCHFYQISGSSWRAIKVLRVFLGFLWYINREKQLQNVVHYFLIIR